MRRKFLTVVLSVILFATIFSCFFFVPSSQREPNVYYFGFFETFVFVILYAGPVYLLVGLPLSIFIDKLVAKFHRTSKWKRYFFGLGLYSLAGTLVGALLPIILNQNANLFDVIPFLICCLVASNISTITCHCWFQK
jgi:urea transporter